MPQFLLQQPHYCWPCQIHALYEWYYNTQTSLQELWFGSLYTGYMLPQSLENTLQKLHIPYIPIRTDEITYYLQKEKRILLLVGKRIWSGEDKWCVVWYINQHYLSIWWSEWEQYMVYDSREPLTSSSPPLWTIYVTKQDLEKQQKLGWYGLYTRTIAVW